MEKAVAIKYETGLPAPFILALGKGELAARIKELAKEQGIRIMEQPELVEGLINMQAGEFIPEIYYKIMAEILVFVKTLQGE